MPMADQISSSPSSHIMRMKGLRDLAFAGGQALAGLLCLRLVGVLAFKNPCPSLFIRG